MEEDRMSLIGSTEICAECGDALERAGAVCHACLMREGLQTGESDLGSGSGVMTPAEMAEFFPQFEILECLGRGGMGVVYRARQKSLNREVAIKVLAPEREANGQFAERFAREAEMLGKMNHPGIVTIYDFGETKGLYFLVMEFVDGVNLREILRDGKLEPERALEIIPQICEALQFAHERGIAHRDIKPENILLDRDGAVKIADFGIAAMAGERAEEKAGTPSYMPPESGADHRGDIYSLGVVFYEMLTGERPGREVKIPSTKVRDGVGGALDEIVLKALSRNPEKRYQAISELSQDLATVPLGQVKSAGKGGRRAMIAASLAAPIIGAGIWAAWPTSPEPEKISNQNNEMNIKDVKKKVGTAVMAVGMIGSAVAEKPERVSEEGRMELKQEARARAALDRQEYSREEQAELEELYQIANKNWKTDRPKAKKAMEDLVKKYKKSNRTGCAMLYLGQLSRGKERDEYLESAIKDFSDCYYFNGVQVGGFARLLRMMDLREDGKDKEAEKLEKELRTKYKKSINHSGYRLVDILDQIAAEQEKK